MDSLTLYVLLVQVSFSFMVSCPAVAQGSSPAMFVFGDSLSDVGNNNYIDTNAKCNFPHYGIDYPGGKPTGRFSNGKNVVDLLAENLGVPSPKPYLSMANTDNPSEFLEGVNFASGSAGILTSTHEGLCIPLETQIYFYTSVFRALVEKLGIFQVQRFISTSIFYINIGSNDILVYDGTGVSKYVRLLISTLEGELKLVFMGTEPVGCWPAVRAVNNRSGDCNREMNQVSSLYNEEAVLLLKKLRSEYADMSYSFFNSYRVFHKLIKHPENYGFDESKAACCGMGYLSAKIPCNPLASYCSDRTNRTREKQDAGETSRGTTTTSQPEDTQPMHLDLEKKRGGETKEGEEPAAQEAGEKSLKWMIAGPRRGRGWGREPAVAPRKSMESTKFPAWLHDSDKIAPERQLGEECHPRGGTEKWVDRRAHQSRGKDPMPIKDASGKGEANLIPNTNREMVCYASAANGSRPPRKNREVGQLTVEDYPPLQRLPRRVDAAGASSEDKTNREVQLITSKDRGGGGRGHQQGSRTTEEPRPPPSEDHEKLVEKVAMALNPNIQQPDRDDQSMEDDDPGDDDGDQMLEDDMPLVQFQREAKLEALARRGKPSATNSSKKGKVSSYEEDSQAPC
ncbi:hypothetical protein J5N97_011301 [Dioscorea zingiberensis]|uniref:GDSL esterase/lipase n=1 Tax=Dioscorea zingiberensis TaxID=325984 RepID=A0A9D5D0C9_9LILI|nr:hypothetical protein J5N97_011301 [Dioscorea zingiberensis]